MAHKKHTRSPTKQVAWNDYGTRHDRARFNTGFSGIKKARDLARDVLKLPPHVQLEEVPPDERSQGLLMESAEISGVAVAGWAFLRLSPTTSSDPMSSGE